MTSTCARRVEAAFALKDSLSALIETSSGRAKGSRVAGAEARARRARGHERRLPGCGPRSGSARKRCRDDRRADALAISRTRSVPTNANEDRDHITRENAVPHRDDEAEPLNSCGVSSSPPRRRLSLVLGRVVLEEALRSGRNEIRRGRGEDRDPDQPSTITKYPSSRSSASS